MIQSSDFYMVHDIFVFSVNVWWMGLKLEMIKSVTLNESDTWFYNVQTSEIFHSVAVDGWCSKVPRKIQDLFYPFLA